MPWMDQTGPAGLGPMTGRGMGWCGMDVGWRRGRGYGRGLGRYFGLNFPQTKAEKQEALDEYRKALEEELQEVGKALKDL